MRLPNLLKMAPAEIVTRGRQAMLKTVERVSYSPANSSREVSKLFYCLDDDGTDAESPVSLFRKGFLEYATESLQLRFRALSPARFFTGASDPLSAGLISLYLPDSRRSIIAAAEKNCDGYFNILGYGWLQFPDVKHSGEVNWQLDAVSGKASPLSHWSRINALDFEQVGDSKVVWEINRHQWLIQLALAWQLTGHDRYAQMFASRVRSWMQANPPGFGINWCSSLEVSCRLISWCWALVLFRGSGAVSPFMHLSMMSTMQAHASHIERYLSSYNSPNTHLTGEALGLFYAGVLLSEISDAVHWRATGRKILLEQLERQTHEDGVCLEQSLHYQCYTLEIYLQFVILSKRVGDQLPDSLCVRLQSMLDFILDMRRPDGTLPAIGDSDGGSLFSIIKREPGDVRALFSVAAVLFDREDYAWAAGGSSPELICLMGASAHYAFLAMKQKPPPLISACLYPDGGYLIMRSARRTRSHQLVFDVGALGCPGSAAHGHADMLAIQCSAFGENFLVDPGTGNYTADPEWRDYFRTTMAHNTVSVDGLSQVEPSGPFSWAGRHPVVSVRSCWTTPEMSLIDASHDAWARLQDPVVHRRRVIFVRQLYWVIVDDLAASEEHLFDLHYQFAPSDVETEDNNWIRAKGAGGSSLMMYIRASTQSQLKVCCGAESPKRGWVSDNYGIRKPAPSISCSTRADGPVRFITILLPQSIDQITRPDVLVRSTVAAGGKDYITIKFGLGFSDHIVVTDDSATMTKGLVVVTE